jgi:DNA polymerase-3 subunit epsilon
MGSIKLFFDTETTGFPNPKSPPEIVQIGAILQDVKSLRILGEINLIVKPVGVIPQACIDIHGITNELAAARGINSLAADKLFAFFVQQADEIVAHNIKFDTDVINGVWKSSAAAILGKARYCTMLEGAKLNIPKRHAGRSKWPKLSDAYMHFYGEEFSNAHDAMADVRACRDVYLKLTEEERAS